MVEPEISVPKQAGVHPLGTWDDRDWFYQVAGDGTGKIVWRVPNIREVIVAPPGYKILTADLPQTEIWIMAILSGDEYLLSQLKAGGDFHCRMAADINQIELAEFIRIYKDHSDALNAVYVDMRYGSKCVSFGIPYGGGEESVGARIKRKNETEEQARLRARAIIERFFQLAWKLKLFLEGSATQSVTKGYSRSVSGRKRFYRIPDRKDPAYRQIVASIQRRGKNMPIQASNSDVLKLAMWYIFLAVRGGDELAPPIHDTRIIIGVHDEIGLYCREEGVEEVGAIQADCMRGAFLHYFPEADIKPEVVAADHWKK